MSIIDSCTLQAETDIKMRKIGESLARTIYVRPVTILISGELGAGKTTFVQGLAKGLGIAGTIVSPTFALEQRYGDVLCHLDLYRLTSPDQAHQILEHSHDFPGIRIIEWAQRATNEIDAGITIAIEEQKQSTRTITCSFSDIAIPTDEEIAGWMDEVMLPEKVRLHTRAVARNCDQIAAALIPHGIIIRSRALHAAAEIHDLLRFVDFNEKARTVEAAATEAQSACWEAIKKEYGLKHEQAASEFLTRRGFKEIGDIVRVHKGWMPDGSIILNTIEQMILAYADKRTIIDRTVTIDERFDDFIKRYGDGKESDRARLWRSAMKAIEQSLFPDGPPF